MVKDNIRVNTINAGLVLTPDWIKTAKQLTADKGGDWEGYLQGVADEHAPIKRFGTPEELAAFLRVPLLGPRDLFDRLDLLRRRRHAEDGLRRRFIEPGGQRRNGPQFPERAHRFLRHAGGGEPNRGDDRGRLSPSQARLALHQLRGDAREPRRRGRRGARHELGRASTARCRTRSR